MCGYFCIGFIGFMLKAKILLDYTNLFSSNDYGNNNKIIKKVLLWINFRQIKMKNIYCTKCKKYKEFKKPKILHICDKILLLSSICNKCGSEDEQMFMEKESNEILKILSLIDNLEEYQKIYNHFWRKHKSRI